MKKLFCIILLLPLLISTVASARVQPLQVCVVNQSALVANSSIETIIVGLQTEIDQAFRKYYYLQRQIHLSTVQTRGCWPLYIVDGSRRAFGYAASGWHWVANGRPYAVVTTYQTTLSLIIGNELLEMLGDPSGRGREICDDWVTYFWQINGVWVPDFALPGKRGRHFCGTVGYCT
jgi:hypothetical protein